MLGGGFSAVASWPRASFWNLIIRITDSIGASLAAAAADSAMRRLLECALAGCGAHEVHVAQFKRCAACKGIVYCCKEHQLADWPAHKAACKAARKTSSK
jgi:hypothetical protein